MADKRISELTALSAVAAGDYLPVVDVSDLTDAASGTTKKVTWTDLFAPLFATANTFTALQTFAAGAVIAPGGTGVSTLTLKDVAGQTADLFRIIRASDLSVGVRSLGVYGFQVRNNLVVGGDGTQTDDGNPRFWFYSGTTGKLLFSSTFALFASDVPLNFDSGTAISGSPDLSLRRDSTNVLAITDADTTGNPSLALQAKSSTTARRDRFRLTTTAVDNTDASRKYRAAFTVYDTAARECLRMEASGTVAMVGFFGANAVIQQATTGETVGFTAGAGTAVRDDSTFTGNVGTKAYRISDIVKALKNLGLLASN